MEQGSPLAFVTAQGRRTLFDALIDARDRHGGRTRIIEDQDRRPLSYSDLIRSAFALGRRLGRITSPREHVGVLLPTSVGIVVTVFALHATGRIPVMLNFTAGAHSVRSACGAAGSGASSPRAGSSPKGG